MIIFQPYPPPKTLTSENTQLERARCYLFSYKASVCLSVFTPSHFLHPRVSESAASWKIQETYLRPLALTMSLKAEFILSFSSLAIQPSQLTTEVPNSACLLNFPPQRLLSWSGPSLFRDSHQSLN